MNINKSNQQIFIHKRAMYKTRNTGTGNGMQGTRVMGECYIPGSVAKHSGECPQTFQGMSLNIPGNILQTFFMLRTAKFDLY